MFPTLLLRTIVWGILQSASSSRIKLETVRQVSRNPAVVENTSKAGQVNEADAPVAVSDAAAHWKAQYQKQRRRREELEALVHKLQAEEEPESKPKQLDPGLNPKAPVFQMPGGSDSGGGSGGGSSASSVVPSGRSKGGSDTRETKLSVKKIFVGGLPTLTTEQELRELFGTWGPIADIELPAKKAYITFEKAEEAKRAVELDGTQFGGNVLKVNQLVIEEDPNGKKELRNKLMQQRAEAEAVRQQSQRERQSERTSEEPEEVD